MLPDLKKGLVSQDKTSQFLDRLGMDFGYKNNSQGLDIIHLGKKNGETKHVISFKVKNSTPGSEGLQKVIAGESLDPVRLSAADDFQGVIRVEGLRMPDDIVEMVILPRAAWEKVVDIFFSDGTCFTDVSIKAYGNKKEIRIIASTKLNTAKITVQRNALMKAKNGFHVNVVVGAKGKHYASAQALLENSEILRCLGHGMGFKCMQNGQLIYEGLERESVTRTVEDAESVKRRVDDIRQLEKAFSIVFRDFALTRDEWDDVTAIAKLLRLEGSTFRLNSPWTFSLDDSEEGKEWKDTLATTSEVGAFVIERSETWTYSFFGWKFAVDVVSMRVLNNAVVKLNKKNKYAASNPEKAVNYVVKELLDKRIISRPQPLVKTPKPSMDDFLEKYS